MKARKKELDDKLEKSKFSQTQYIRNFIGKKQFAWADPDMSSDEEYVPAPIGNPPSTAHYVPSKIDRQSAQSSSANSNNLSQTPPPTEKPQDVTTRMNISPRLHALMDSPTDNTRHPCIRKPTRPLIPGTPSRKKINNSQNILSDITSNRGLLDDLFLSSDSESDDDMTRRRILPAPPKVSKIIDITLKSDVRKPSTPPIRTPDLSSSESDTGTNSPTISSGVSSPVSEVSYTTELELAYSELYSSEDQNDFHNNPHNWIVLDEC